jgi:short-subunit dehydrogenase
MLERRCGHIVNVASVAGRIPSPREAAYTAAKHALCGWTDVLAADLARSGVKVHLVNPGPIETEIWDKLDEPAAYSGRLHSPDDVAAAVRACLEKGTFERWEPRALRALWPVHSLVPGLFARATGIFDERGSKSSRRSTAP